MYKGQIKGFPTEVVDKMLERQVEQGNARDVTVFEERLSADAVGGGFGWNETIEGFTFWSRVTGGDFDIFFERYPKQETHICKYCKAETLQPDDECYAKPKQQSIEEAANEYAEHQSTGMVDKTSKFECINDFIAGTKSEAAKEYWFEQFNKLK